MAIILASSKPHHFFNYNSISKFCCASKELTKSSTLVAIEGVGQVFLTHGVEKRFGLFMNHRHFSLSSDEILVETLTKDGTLSVSMPWEVQGETAFPTESPLWDRYNLDQKNQVAAQTWLFDNQGKLQPYEYLAMDDDQEEIISPPPAAFAQDLFLELERYGVEKLFGLKHIGDARSVESFEVTPVGGRTSITGFGRQPDEMKMDDFDNNLTKVLWYFGTDGKPIATSNCARCGYCGSCNN